MNSRPSTPTALQRFDDAQPALAGNAQTDSPDESQPVPAHTLSPPSINISTPGEVGSVYRKFLCLVLMT